MALDRSTSAIGATVIASSAMVSGIQIIQTDSLMRRGSLHAYAPLVEERSTSPMWTMR